MSEGAAVVADVKDMTIACDCHGGGLRQMGDGGDRCGHRAEDTASWQVPIDGGERL